LSSKRKTLTIDRAVADKIKDIAARRGMSISSYMRKLVEKLEKLEGVGIYAPTAMDEAYTLAILRQMRFVPIPLDLLANPNPETAYSIGLRVGRMLKEMGLDPSMVVEELARLYGVATSRGNRLLIVVREDLTALLSHLVIGVAEGCGLRVEKSEGLAIVELEKSGGGGEETH